MIEPEHLSIYLWQLLYFMHIFNFSVQLYLLVQNTDVGLETTLHSMSILGAEVRQGTPEQEASRFSHFLISFNSSNSKTKDFCL